MLFSSSTTLLALIFEAEKSISTVDVATSRLAMGGKKSPLQGWQWEANRTARAKTSSGEHVGWERLDSARGLRTPAWAATAPAAEIQLPWGLPTLECPDTLRAWSCSVLAATVPKPTSLPSCREAPPQPGSKGPRDTGWRNLLQRCFRGTKIYFFSFLSLLEGNRFGTQDHQRGPPS